MAAVWTRTPDRRIWVAEAPGGQLLAVAQLAKDSWRSAVAGPDGEATWPS